MKSNLAQSPHINCILWNKIQYRSHYKTTIIITNDDSGLVMRLFATELFVADGLVMREFVPKLFSVGWSCNDGICS